MNCIPGGSELFTLATLSSLVRAPQQFVFCLPAYFLPAFQMLQTDNSGKPFRVLAAWKFFVLVVAAVTEMFRAVCNVEAGIIRQGNLVCGGRLPQSTAW